MRIKMVNPSENPTVIKVVGVGGGGGNAVNRMVEVDLQNVEFISVNTDKQALSYSKAAQKIVIGEEITGGLGAGTDPTRGERAALEDIERIEAALRGAHLVFITSGFGGGTGTGASPVIAKVAKEMGALTIGVVTKPFEMEGQLKRQRAEEGIEKMLDYVDSLIVIPNENLIKILDKNISFEHALRVADDVLRNGVQGISDIITVPGMIVNVDFADIRTMVELSRGIAHMGIGIGKGEDRIQEAVHNALHNPLLEVESVKGAKGLLANLVCPKNFSLQEYNQASTIINSYADVNANIKIGTCTDESLDDEIRVTVIATGFQQNSKKAETAEQVFVDAMSGVKAKPSFKEQKVPTSPSKAFNRETPARVQKNDVKPERPKESFTFEPREAPAAAQANVTYGQPMHEVRAEAERDAYAAEHHHPQTAPVAHPAPPRRENDAHYEYVRPEPPAPAKEPAREIAIKPFDAQHEEYVEDTPILNSLLGGRGSATRDAHRNEQQRRESEGGFKLPYGDNLDIISDEEMELHKKRSIFDTLPSLEDEEELAIPPFMRGRRRKNAGLAS